MESSLAFSCIDSGLPTVQTVLRAGIDEIADQFEVMRRVAVDQDGACRVIMTDELPQLPQLPQLLLGLMDASD